MLTELVVRTGGAIEAGPHLLCVLTAGVDHAHQIFAVDQPEGEMVRQTACQRLAAGHGAARDQHDWHLSLTSPPQTSKHLATAVGNRSD